MLNSTIYFTCVCACLCFKRSQSSIYEKEKIFRRQMTIYKTLSGRLRDDEKEAMKKSDEGDVLDVKFTIMDYPA